MHLSDATWTDVRDATIDAAVIPVGSTEQHGPHAPLGTDALNAASVAAAGADAYAEMAADASADAVDASDRGDAPASRGDADRGDASVFSDVDRGDVLVTPTIPVGIAEEHRAFDGTLWVSPDTFRAYVRETAASLVHHGIDRVVLANGHGGNIDALAEVARRFSRDPDHGGYAVAFTWFDAVGEHASEMGHGGPLETALLRATHPELVREDRIEAAAAGAADRWGEWVAGVNLAHDSDAFTDNGVIGDPREGDRERGERLLELASDSLADLLAAVVDRELDAN